MPADSRLEVLFEINSKLDGLNTALNRVDRMRKGTGLLDRGLARTSKAFDTFARNIGRGAVIAGAALFASGGVFAADSFNKFAEFEARMKGVEAVLKPTTKQLKSLEKEAKRLGRTTKFSAREAASGIEILAKNGVKTEDILGGVLEASLNLSASVGTDLPAAADTLTDALAVFELGAGDAADVVDKINAVTINSKFSFEDFQAALASGGASAKIAGQSFGEFSSVISATASFFDSGETAGTAYKVFIDRLIPSSDAALAAQKKLGLEVFDSAGKLKDLADIAGQLDRGLGKLSDEDRISSLTKLFGTRGKNFATALATAGEEGIKTARFLAQFADATEQANKRLEGTQGSIVKFKSAFEGLQIAIGQPLAETITPFLDAFTKKIGESARAADEGAPALGGFFKSGVLLGAGFLDVISATQIAINELVGFVLEADIGIRKLGVAIEEAGDSVGLSKEGDLARLKQGLKEAEEFQKQLILINLEAKENLASNSATQAAEKILADAKKIADASAELRDEEVAFINLQKRLQDQTENKADSKALEVTKLLIEEQKKLVDERKQTLNSLRQTAPEEVAELEKVEFKHADVVTAAAELAEATGRSTREVLRSIRAMSSDATQQLKLLETAFESVQRTMQKTTTAGQQFHNDATQNSWLKDMALEGIGFLKSLVDEGFSPLGNSLKTITQAGAAASAIASGQLVAQQTIAGPVNPLVGIAGGETEASGIAGNLLSDEESLRLRYEQERAIITEEETLSALQKQALLTGLERKLQDELGQIRQSEVDRDLARQQDRIDKVSGFARNLTTVIFGNSKKAFKIQQGIDIAQALSTTYRNAVAARASQLAIPTPDAPIRAGVAMASEIVSGLAQVAQIRSQRPPQGFFTGGFIGGRNARPAGFDNTTIRAETGEFMLRSAVAQSLPASFLEGLNASSNPAGFISDSLTQPSLSPLATLPEITVEAPAQSGEERQQNLTAEVLLDSDAFMDRVESRLADVALDAFRENKTEFGL